MAKWLERWIWTPSTGPGLNPVLTADVVLSSPEFNFLAALINSQLVCLPPVGILNLVMFYLNVYLSLFVYIGPEKPQRGVAIKYTYIH